MYQLILWSTVAAFALLCASSVFGLVAYRRSGIAWLRYYLVYLACYAAWLLLTASFYLQAAYLPAPASGFSSAATTLQVVVSLAILYAGPALTLRLSDIRLGRRQWWLLSLPVAFVLGTILAYYATGFSEVVLVPNCFFNFYLGAHFLYASMHTAEKKEDTLRKAFRPFLLVSTGAYLLLLFADILAATVPLLLASPLLTAGPVCLYCLIWSILAISTFAKRMGFSRDRLYET